MNKAANPVHARHARFLRGGLGLLVLGLGSSEVQQSPTLAKVEVTPATAMLAPGATQQFTAKGRLTDGKRAAVEVAWSATGGTITSNGLYKAGSTIGQYRVIAVEQGGTKADTSTVTIASAEPLPANTEVVVRVSPAPSGLKWLLQDGDVSTASTASCPSDLVTPFDGGEVSVGTPQPGCATEYSVFAVGFAPVLDLEPMPVLEGSQGILREALAGPWQVELNIVTDYAAALGQANDDQVRANELFATNSMGITFTTGTTKLIDPAVDTKVADGMQGGCAAAAALSLYDATRLNVFYASEARWNSVWKSKEYYGYDCGEEGFPAIIFIREDHVGETLAHEIGHALGLRHGLAAYFSSKNLMQQGVWNPEDNFAVDHFTLGQAYRANFHGRSWLNAGGPRSGNPTKSCLDVSLGNSGIDWPCPDVTLEWTP